MAPLCEQGRLKDRKFVEVTLVSVLLFCSVFNGIPRLSRDDRVAGLPKQLRQQHQLLIWDPRAQRGLDNHQVHRFLRRGGKRLPIRLAYGTPTSEDIVNLWQIRSFSKLLL